jgi:hypothetical protein
MSRQASAVVFLAAAVAMAVPATSSAVVTIGSDLGPPPNGYWEDPALAPVTVAIDDVPGLQSRSPTAGVVVRWRIKTDGDPGFAPFAFRVIDPPGVGAGTGPQETLPAAANPTVHTFNNLRLPIKAGGYIGVDTKQVPPGPYAAYLHLGSGGSMLGWNPSLPDGQTRPSTDVFVSFILLVNADVEPDADGDAYGDESQDKCKTDPFPAGGVCTPPQLNLGGRTSQRVSGKGVVVEVGCPTEACTANAKGTVAVPGAAKVYKLRPATKQLTAGAKAKLKLKFAKKTSKAVKRALKKRRKIKAKVTVTAKDLGAQVTTKKRTIKLKR